MRHSTAIGALAIWLVAQAVPVAAQTPTVQPNPQIQVDYVQPKDTSPASDPTQYKRYMATYEWLQVRKPLDEIQKFMAPLKLPRSIKIQVDSCGAERRPYVPANPVTGAPASPVTICYELIDKIQKIAAGVKDNEPLKRMVIVGTFTQAVLHELAYAVFDVLEVPVWGREDDAADRLAAFVLLQFSGEIAHTTMVGSAEFFLLSLRTWTGSAFAGTTSPEGQRFYNFLCIAYGGDSNDFGGWTEAPEGQDPLLPEHRARQCGHEYQQVRAAFNLRIMPYINPDVLLQVKAAQWFMPGELSK